MKILFLVTHLLSGGAERTVSYLSSYMAKKGWDVTVLSITDDIFYELGEGVKLVKLGIPSSSRNIADRALNVVRRYIYASKEVKKRSPDVVFCMLPDVAKYILGTCERNRIKLLTSERNNPQFVQSKNEINTKIKVFNQADGIVFQTERVTENFSEDIKRKGRVIHNAVGNEQVYTAVTPEIREKKFTAIGRLDQQKDYPTMFRAFAKVLEKHPEYSLEIFGGGSDLEKLTNMAKELGIADNVRFMGVSKNAITEAAKGSCFVMSSIFEGMPNALMEAMAVGLPCVSTDCPYGPAELIEDGVSGLLVPVGDSDALAEAMLKMIEDTAFAEECGRKAKAILDTHSIDAIAEQYCKFITEKVKGVVND
ncbi:MAG: glycosyltransferase family 4 protein [Ruminococcaceae bacterium]|nr:glycosyltransferase family 4 protein [Oscillospiraceae bacterium]